MTALQPCGPAQGYVAGLDGLRAVAVLLVVLFHARVPGFDGGFLGVDVFFVLSGYLITELLLAEISHRGGIDLYSFWWRRMLRLFPALGLMVVVFLISGPFLPQQPVASLWQAFLALSYLSDYARALTELPDELSHSWSLAVEVKFYLLWPLVLLALSRRLSPVRLAQVIGMMALVATLWRMINLQIGLPWDAVYYRFDTRLSGLLVGAAAAGALRAGLAAHLHRLPVWSAMLLVGVVPALSCGFGDRQGLIWGPTLYEAATLLIILIVLAGRGPVARGLAWAPLAGLGRLSYGVYLWHYPVMRALRDATGWQETLLVGLPVSVGLAWVSAVTVERLAKRYGRPRGAGATRASAA